MALLTRCSAGAFCPLGFKVDQCANDLTNEFMCSFDKRVCRVGLLGEMLTALIPV